MSGFVLPFLFVVLLTRPRNSKVDADVSAPYLLRLSFIKYAIWSSSASQSKTGCSIIALVIEKESYRRPVTVLGESFGDSLPTSISSIPFNTDSLQ